MRSINDPSRLMSVRGYVVLSMKITACLIGVLVAVPALAMADSAKFDIPVQPLPAALKEFAVQAHMQLLYQFDAVSKLKGGKVTGEMDKHLALQQLLRDTGLQVTFTGADAATIGPASPASSTKAENAARKEGKTDSSHDFRVARVDPEQASEPASPLAARGGQASVELQEVVVTAQKRSARLSDVAIPVQAVTAEDLTKEGARNFSDYAHTLAGVQVSEVGPGQNQIFIRGVAAPQGYIGMESAIGVYLDDVPISEGMNQPDLNLYDVERVEVLRGPQGTLYGSASLGGTIRIITNQPKIDLTEVNLDTEISGTERGGVNPAYSASFNIPLVPDFVAARAVAYGRNPSGYISDPTLGRTRVNDEDTYGGRLDVRIAPSGSLSFDLKAMEQHTHLGGTNFADSVDGSYVQLDQYRHIPEPFIDASQIYNGTVHYQGSVVTIDSSTSFSRRRRDIYNDYTGADFLGDGALTPSYQRYIAEALTEELRVGSVQVKPFSWLVGAYFNRTSDDFYQSIESAGAGAMFGLPTDNVAVLKQTATDRQKALFGEVGYSPVDRLTLTAGMRVADLSLDSNALREGLLVGGVLQNAGSTRQHATAPKANISWQLTADALVYAQAAKGYRIGGVNPTIQSLNGFVFPPSYGPDSLWNYELGFKGLGLQRRLSFDTDVFYIDWKNIQLDLLHSGIDYFANAGNAVSKGAEAQGVFQVSDRWQIGGQATFTDARLTSTTPGVGNDGDRVPFVPRFSGSAFIEWNTPIKQGRGYVRLDGQYVGTAFTGFGQTGNYSYGDYTLANIRLGFDQSSWRFAVFAKNLFNRRATLFAQPYYSGVLTDPAAASVVVARPLTIGGEVSWQFQ